MHKCNRNGSNTLNLWPFYHFAPSCEIDLQTTWTNMFQMPLLRIKNDIFAKLFWNQSIYIEVMACTKSRRTHTHAHIFTRTNTKRKLWLLYLAHRQRERRKEKEKTTTYNMIFKFVQPYPYDDLKSVIIGLFASQLKNLRQKNTSNW